MTGPTQHPASTSDARKRRAEVSLTPAPLHAIRWEFDDGSVTATAVCHAPEGADCRLTSVSCECERWGEIRRDEIGVPWHKTVDWYGGPIDSAEPQWHELKHADYCNVCLFINESGCVEELGAGTFTIGEVPINPVWIDDGCDWERAGVLPDLATIRDGLAAAIAYAERHDGRVPVGMLRALLGGEGR